MTATVYGTWHGDANFGGLECRAMIDYRYYPGEPATYHDPEEMPELEIRRARAALGPSPDRHPNMVDIDDRQLCGLLGPLANDLIDHALERLGAPRGSRI